MVYVFWYKIICLLVGLVIIFLGYLLFIKGIFNESGDIGGNFKNFKLTVKKAAPGTYFILFGSMIIGMIVFKGFTGEETNTGNKITLGDTMKIDTNIKIKDSIKFGDSTKVKRK